MNSNVSIVWFRKDLRLRDNPALNAALKQSQHIVPLFIWSPEEESPWEPGAASRWWLYHSLKKLGEDLVLRGCRLIVSQGTAFKCLKSIINQTKATRVFWNETYHPVSNKRDLVIKTKLEKNGIEVAITNGLLLFDPKKLKNKANRPYLVYGHFLRCCLASKIEYDLSDPPKQINGPRVWPKSVDLKKLALLPKIKWHHEIERTWKLDSTNADKLLNKFLKNSIKEYDTKRDFPAENGTSRLSPYLHFGEISPKRIYKKISESNLLKNKPGVKVFLREILWREFAYHLIYHFPKTSDKPLRSEFENFPWKVNKKWLTAWKKGMTGYPIVDAGMRELWHTGWMHNRVRMIVASFLVKDLMIPWQEGAKWFWDTLVDADLASNTLNWQWVAGCGADAAPFFRIFNPEIQGKKFDPVGVYIKKWIPELGNLSTKWIHSPWKAPQELTLNYPKPIVDHQQARDNALEAYAFRELES